MMRYTKQLFKLAIVITLAGHAVCLGGVCCIDYGSYGGCHDDWDWMECLYYTEGEVTWHSGDTLKCLGDDTYPYDGYDDFCVPPPEYPDEACCWVEGCSDISWTECMGNGGWPQGEGSSCENDCEPTMGCCEWDNSSCFNTFGEEGCEAKGGTSHPGVMCMGDNPPTDGYDDLCVDPPPAYVPCCFSEGSCDDELPADICESLNGIVGGPPGTKCSDIDCPHDWACCFGFPDGSCTDLAGPWCANEGGLHLNGVKCSDFPCETERACCIDDEDCVDMKPSVCLDAQGAPQETGVMCSDFPCEPEQACCFPDGTCDDRIVAECWEDDGTPYAGIQCYPGLCEPEEWACCLSDGTCDEMTVAECWDNDGTPHVGIQCSDFPCETERACCFNDDICLDMLPSDCWDDDGTPQEAGVMCSDTPCVKKQACCFVDGECENLDPDTCWSEGGTPKPLGVMCSDTHCPDARACCKPDGDCEMWTEDYCIANDWIPSGPQCLGDGDHDGWDDACKKIETQGACCNLLGGCFELGETACIANGWTWAGPGTECLGDNDDDGSDDRCPDLGACCDPVSGDCSIQQEQVCLADDGEWRGPGTLCLGDSNHDGRDDGCGSRPGACCNPWGMCFQLRQAACVSNGWKWHGPDTVCMGDFNMDGLDDTCQDLGACCDPSSGQCFERTSETDCIELSGIWHGSGTECAGDGNHDGVDDACPGVGKCCDPLGNCYVVTQEICNELPGMEWGPPGTQCLGDTDNNGLDNGCEGYGACCDPVSGNCRILMENQCVQRGWIWHRAGTKCLGDKNHDGVDDVCNPLGACCDSSGFCWNLTEAVCNMQGRGWNWNGGTQCLGDTDGDGEDDACRPPREKTGACCDPVSGRCQNLTEHDCLGRGWDWSGANTQCLGDKDSDGRDDACGLGGLGEDKWTQPPVGVTGQSNTSPFNGWDERSWYAASGVVADDWLCEDNRPVTGIRWWGSFVGWTNQELPSAKPRAFHIGIWTDVPAGAEISHPGEMVWEYWCRDWEWEFVGYNDDPRPLQKDDACFLFTVHLPTADFFHQKGQGSTAKYWLSISAEYNPDGPQPDYIWGWTTRPDVLNDGAVKIGYPNKPEIGSVYQGGNPICSPPCLKKGSGEPWDAAFELMTN